MRLSELALNLLDLNPEKSSIGKGEYLVDIEKTIEASLLDDLPKESFPVKEDSMNSYSVASRMGKSNYDEVAKAEALLLALKKMRAKNAAGFKSTRVIRNT
jgi:hypothetical protein